MGNGRHHVHISSGHKWFDLKLGEVWKYRDLIWLFTKRALTVSYKQTVLGPAWLIISPFLTSVVYTFLFGNIAGMGTDGIPQILFYLSSNAIWGYFAASFQGNASTFIGNAGVFGKVYFPRLTVPISNILIQIIHFGIQMLMVAIFLVYFLIKGEISPNWYMFPLIPLILIHLGIMGLGMGIIASSITTKYRDLSVVATFFISMLMYATPVVYPLSQLGDGTLKQLILYNPVTPVMELFRLTLLGKGEILVLPLIVSWAFTIVVLLAGIVLFNKVERTFMDTV